MLRRFLTSRATIFFLAFLSFACLLGTFYGLWSMHVFACLILPPATALLAWAGWLTRDQPRSRRSPHTWIVEGALAGIVAAAAYDIYRLPFVLHGAPLFKVFPRFGALILGGSGPSWLIQLTGWTYHFSNGAALGIMFLCLTASAPRRWIPAGAIGWALFVEAMLLMSPYAQFFGLKLDGTFLFLTISAHAVFGATLGLWLRRRLPA
jgi:hypothetical protein